ncbi:MAG: glycosyltransferase [Candidatus Berkelbacteria bacterium]|nr:MAG: glycosyltransferase [Candidatus Berkelbacteria bacterium]QQG51917.1 MAG: glycosyltransferase [Candidatus Berkelbacteria bacterium]
MLELKEFRNRPVLTHLKRLTTKDGLVQHADKEVPDPSFGYSIDDNARALMVCLWHHKIFGDEAILRLAEIYFNYVKKVEKDGGSFHNFLSFTEQILDNEGSEDSIGRAIWALGEACADSPMKFMKEAAEGSLKRSALEHHLEHPHVRTKAYVLLGLISANDETMARIWANKLVDIFHANSSPDWQWFEEALRYANGILPYALAKAYISTKDKRYLEISEQSFRWLNGVSRLDDKPAPIGQNGWYFKDGDKAEYDQQPLEAADMVLAATALYEATKNEEFLRNALEWMSWYHGNNTANKPLISEQTGGIYDAVTPGGVNENQGAESIVTYLLAYLALSEIAHESA